MSKFIYNPFTRRMDAVSSLDSFTVDKTGPIAIPGDGQWKHLDTFDTQGMICNTYQFAYQNPDRSRTGLTPFVITHDDGLWEGAPGMMFGAADMVDFGITVSGSAIDVFARAFTDIILMFISESF